MRFEVPQFIKIEDKIFGPLTWRQFVYVSGSAGIIVVLFLMTPIIIFILFGLPVAVLGFALAFYPVNDRPFSTFLEAMFHFFRGEKLYLWRKQSRGVYQSRRVVNSQSAKRLHKTPATKESGIQSLSRNLELSAIQNVEQTNS